MGEQNDDVQQDGNGLPNGYAEDRLTVALGLPVVNPVPVQNRESIEPVDHSNAVALHRSLAGAEDRITADSARLKRLVAANRDNLRKAGNRHADALELAASELERTRENALSTIKRLNDHVEYLHGEYLKAAGKQLPSATTFRDQLQDQATPVSKVDTDTTQTLQRLDREIAQIIADAQQDLKSYQEQVAIARKAWELAAAALEAKIDTLDDLGSGVAPDLRTALDLNRKTAPDDYVAAKAALPALVQRCAHALESHGESIEISRALRKQQIAAIKSKMELPSWWQRLGDTWDVKKLFKTKMDQAEKLVGSASNEQALIIAVDLAKQSKEIYDDFMANEKKVEQISWDQSAITGVLDTYKADRPKDYAALKKRFEALEKSWSKKKPSELALEYAAFKTEVDGANGAWDNFRGRCESERRWREDFTRVATEVQDSLDLLDKRIRQANPVDGAEGYQGTAKAELRGLTATASTEQLEGTTAPLTKRIMALRTRVAAYLLVPASVLASPQEPGDDKAKEFYQDQIAGAASRKAYLEEFAKVKVAHDLVIEAHIKLGEKSFNDDDQREYDDIKKLINQAAVIVKANKDESDLQDVATANALIARCTERMTLLETGGPQIDRGKLGALQSDWVKGVAAFEAKGADLVKAVKTLAAEEPVDDGLAGAGDEVAKLVTTALGFFNRFEFSKETLALSDDAPEKKAERKRARETALTKVHQAMDYMTGSAVTQSLINNPFGVAAVGTALFRTMRKIELEVLRGV